MKHAWLVEAWLLEAALRSLVMGATIFVILQLLRIRQVRAQRTAWVLALLAAVVMPALAGWPVGPQRLPTHIIRMFRTSMLPPPALQSVPVPGLVASDGARNADALHNAGLLVDGQLTDSGTMLRMRKADPQPARADRRPVVWLKAIVMRGATASAPYAIAAYGCVAFILLGRLVTGLLLALRLRRHTVKAPRYYGALQPGDDIRISARLRTPATIGSTIVLPEASAEWDANRVLMVLAHERAHVQQADFSVQLLAGLHCALFWFSPFSWWLQHRLAALGEAMSDLAALQHADSRSAYAEVLLEFATSLRQPMAVVSMARFSNLRPRIERLLNDRLFREAISARRRHPFLAAGIVPVALLASASLVRVHAAVPTAQPQPQAAAPAVPAIAAPGVATEVTVARNPLEPIAPDAIVITPTALAADSVALAERAMPARLQIQELDTDKTSQVEEAAGSGEVYGVWGGDSYAFIRADEDSHLTGHFDDRLFNALRNRPKGDFIFYKHAGKAFITQDPALIAIARTLDAEQEQLGRKQEELGRRQEALGKRQGELGRQQEAVKTPAPDAKKELAELHQALQAAEQSENSPEASLEKITDLQGKLADIQGRLAELQVSAAEAMGRLAEQQGTLGAEQGKLGAEQGRLGAQQGKLALEAQRRMKPLLERAIQDGRAKPVD